MAKIFDGDVKARVDIAISNYKANKRVYFNNEMKNYAVEVKNIDKLYKTGGWKKVATLISEVNHRCWEEYIVGQENVSKYYAELYHAACAWYQGYPANQYEEDNADEDGCFDHVSDEDFSRIYNYLD